MTRTSSRALALSRPIIQVLTIANLLYATGITALLVSSLVRPEWPWEPLGWEMDGAHPGIPAALRAIMVIGIAAAALVHVILRRLLAIVGTVRGGDPFVAENARRLQSIAWGVLGLELMRLAVHSLAAVTAMPGGEKLEFGSSFVPAAWLAVLLLFVLAGVFAHGARMRADLEGTV